MHNANDLRLPDEKLATASEEQLRSHYELLLKEYEAEVGISDNGRVPLDIGKAFAAKVNNYVTVVDAIESTEGYRLFKPLTDNEIVRVVDGALAVGFGPPQDQPEHRESKMAAKAREIIGELLRLPEGDTEEITDL